MGVGILELKNITAEWNEKLTGWFSQVDKREERVSKLKNRSTEIIQSEEHRKKIV